MSASVGSSGKPYPIIAFGAGTAYYGQTDAVEKGVVDALKAGFTHLDNAEVYANETVVGKVLAATKVPRDKLFITTKVLSGAGDIPKTITRQLKELHVDFVDLYLIHDPTAPAKNGKTLSEAWADMESVQTAGQAKEIGVSNYRIAHLEETLKSAKSKPVVNQIELHPYIWSEAERIVDYCHQHDIRIAAYSPQAPLTKFSGGPVDAVVDRIAKDLSITPGQVLLKWAQKAGDFLVTTTGKVERMTEMLEVPSLPDLSQAHFDEIAEAGKQGGPKRVWMGHVTDDVVPVSRS